MLFAVLLILVVIRPEDNFTAVQWRPISLFNCLGSAYPANDNGVWDELSGSVGGLFTLYDHDGFLFELRYSWEIVERPRPLKSLPTPFRTLSVSGVYER